MKVRLKQIAFGLLSVMFLVGMLYMFDTYALDWKALVAVIFGVACYVSFNRMFYYSDRTKKFLAMRFASFIEQTDFADVVVRNWIKQDIFRKIYLKELIRVFLFMLSIDDKDGAISEWLLANIEKDVSWIYRKRIVPPVEAE